MRNPSPLPCLYPLPRGSRILNAGGFEGAPHLVDQAVRRRAPARDGSALSRMATRPNPDARNEEPGAIQFDVALPGDVNRISPAVDWIMQLIGDLEFGKEKEFEIEMALREALANAIVHGCKGDPSKMVECSVRGNTNEGIQIVVRDPGAGFDPAQLPSPTETENLHSDHGRGILLIKKLMDEVTHEQNGTVIRMRKF